jgi:hypothetical protein
VGTGKACYTYKEDPMMVKELEDSPKAPEPTRELPDGGEFGAAAPTSALCVYTDPANVDFSSGEDSEGPAILADLRGYLTDGDARLTEVPNMADMGSKCVPGGTMVVPECEKSEITADQAEFMKSYVEAGGTVIFSEHSVTKLATAVNVISSGKLNWVQGSQSEATKKTDSDRFADCPDTLPALSGGSAVTAASFGDDGNVLYESTAGDVLVGQIRVGAGQVWFLGFDWYTGSTSSGGCTSGQTGSDCVRDGWAQTLAAAVGKEADTASDTKMEQMTEVSEMEEDAEGAAESMAAFEETPVEVMVESEAEADSEQPADDKMDEAEFTEWLKDI